MEKFSIIAALRNDISNQEIINEIEQNNASVHEKDEQNISVLIYAIEWGKNEIAEHLIDQGAKLNAMTFYVSALAWNESLIKRHIDTGLDVDLSYSSYTPLLTAIAALDRHFNSGRYGVLISIVELLIANGADVNFKNEDLGQSALHFAAHYGAKELVSILLENGANIQALDNQGYTPIHHVCIGGHNDSVLEQLMEAGADINSRDGIYGQTPLHLAVLFYRYSSVFMLKRLGADQYIGISKELPFKNEQPYFDLVFPVGTTPLKMAKELDMTDISGALLSDDDLDITFV